MKKILLMLISLFTFITIKSSANAIKIETLYLDTARFFGEIKVGIESTINGTWLEKWDTDK